MALFFFISGFFYKEKNSKDPYAYVGKKLKELWGPMIKYIVAFILLHNIFLKLNIYSELSDQPMIYPTVYYTLLDTLNYCFNTIFQSNYPVEMAGAMWFVLPLIVAMGMFSFVRYWVGFVNIKVIPKELVIGIIIFILTLIGFVFSKNLWKFAWRIDVALFSIPIVYLGYLYKMIINVNLKWYFAVIALFIIYYLYKTGYRVSYVEAIIGNPIKFAFAVISGIYINLYIAKYINITKNLSKVIALLGKNSFHIMALHFLSFKVINMFDIIIIIIINKPIFMLAQYPYSNDKLWIMNLFAGLFIPMIVVYGFKFIRSKKDYFICRIEINKKESY